MTLVFIKTSNWMDLVFSGGGDGGAVVVVAHLSHEVATETKLSQI